MQTSAPKPPVTDLMYSTGSVVEELHVCVAPNSLAQASLRSSMSTATIVDAPASWEPAMAPSPTPPQPNTATVLPRVTPPVLIAAPMPAITPHPSSPAAVAGACGSIFVHWPAATRVLSANAPIPRAGDSSVPSVERHLLRRVVGGEAVPRLAAAARPALPAHGPPVEDDVVARGDLGDACADRLDRARRLVAEEERELVVDPALAVVQVGVAHAARLDRDDASPGPGIGDHDGLDRHRLTLGPGDDSSYFLRHDPGR